MDKPQKPRTPEAAALSAAFKATHAPKMAHLADALGVTPGLVSQWASGHRPVPWEKAPALAGRLGVLPEHISASYRSAAAHFHGSQKQIAEHPPASYGAWAAYQNAPPATRAAVDLLLLPLSERGHLDAARQLAIATLEQASPIATTRTKPAAA